jgi:peptidyl-prolyl cis-trans isomerase C
MILKPARLMIALLALVAAPVFAQSTGNAATVNGKAIPNAKIDQLAKRVAAQGKQPDSPQLRESIKRELIGMEVLMQEADKQGFGTRADVKAALENARQQIIITAMLADYSKKNPPKDAEIKAEYERLKAQVPAKEYHPRHILVATEDEAKAVITKIKSGSKFEDLAKAQSKDGSAANGGDLGWTDMSQFVPEFSKAAIALQKGAVTDTPVKSQFGYHVIKMEDVRVPTVPGLEEAKQQVAESVQQRKVAAFREELMKKAKIQ